MLAVDDHDGVGGALDQGAPLGLALAQGVEQAGVVDADRGLSRQAGEHAQVLLGEGAGGGPILEVEHADRLAALDDREHQQRTDPGLAQVGVVMLVGVDPGVVEDQRGLAAHRFVHERAGEQLACVVERERRIEAVQRRAEGLGRVELERAAALQQDRAAIGPGVLAGAREQLREHAVEVGRLGQRERVLDDAGQVDRVDLGHGRRGPALGLGRVVGVAERTEALEHPTLERVRAPARVAAPGMLEVADGVARLAEREQDLGPALVGETFEVEHAAGDGRVGGRAVLVARELELAASHGPLAREEVQQGAGVLRAARVPALQHRQGLPGLGLEQGLGSGVGLGVVAARVRGCDDVEDDPREHPGPRAEGWIPVLDRRAQPRSILEHPADDRAQAVDDEAGRGVELFGRRVDQGQAGSAGPRGAQELAGAQVGVGREQQGPIADALEVGRAALGVLDDPRQGPADREGVEELAEARVASVGQHPAGTQLDVCGSQRGQARGHRLDPRLDRRALDHPGHALQRGIGAALEQREADVAVATRGLVVGERRRDDERELDEGDAGRRFDAVGEAELDDRQPERGVEVDVAREVGRVGRGQQ